MEKLHPCCGDVGGEQQRVGRSTGEEAERAGSWLSMVFLPGSSLQNPLLHQEVGEMSNCPLHQCPPLVGLMHSQSQVNQDELGRPPASHQLIQLPHICGEKKPPPSFFFFQTCLCRSPRKMAVTLTSHSVSLQQPVAVTTEDPLKGLTGRKLPARHFLWGGSWKENKLLPKKNKERKRKLEAAFVLLPLCRCSCEHDEEVEHERG